MEGIYRSGAGDRVVLRPALLRGGSGRPVPIGGVCIGEGEGAVARVDAVEADPAPAVERAGLDDAVGQHTGIVAAGRGFAGFIDDFHFHPGFEEPGGVNLLCRRFYLGGPGVRHGARLREQDPVAALDGLIQRGPVDAATAALHGGGEEGQFIDLPRLPDGAFDNLLGQGGRQRLFPGTQIAFSQSDIAAAGDLKGIGPARKHDTQERGSDGRNSARQIADFFRTDSGIICASVVVSTPGQHVVQQGECLVKIAARYGFQDYRAVYEHPANAAFRQKRPNPNVIYPGDVVVIPPKRVKEVVAATGKVHRFVIPGARKVLRVRLLDATDTPIANEAAELSVNGGPAVARRTDGNGLLELELPVEARSATIAIRGRKLPLDLSYLNPVAQAPDDGASGVQHRLRNLGYYAGPVTETFDRKTRLALWLFQFDHDLKTDGRPSAETVRKLVEVHGC